MAVEDMAWRKGKWEEGGFGERGESEREGARFRLVLWEGRRRGRHRESVSMATPWEENPSEPVDLWNRAGFEV